MDKINYNEYLEALEKINIFHRQIQHTLTTIGLAAKSSEINASEPTLIDFLQKHATDRLLCAVKFFLESETAYRKIPFSSVEEISIAFFAENYTLNRLKTIRGLGPKSLLLLREILLKAGYKIY